MAFHGKILEKILDENLWGFSSLEKYFGVFLTPKFNKYCGMTSLKIIFCKNKNIVKNTYLRLQNDVYTIVLSASC